MIFLQIGIAFLLLVVAPMIVGQMWASCRKDRISPGFNWISGQLTLWAGFFLVCVPLVLMRKNFQVVCICYSLFMGGLFLISFGSLLYHRNMKSIKVKIVVEKEGRSKSEMLVWLVFGIIMLLFYVAAVAFSYADGDDSYYVTSAAQADFSGWMYLKDTYTGVTVSLDMRHVLAPFPMWVAYIARVTGFHTAIVAHTILPITNITLFFVNVYLVASTVMEDKKDKVPLLMVLTQVLVVFGNYSIYTPENFLVARSAQGKAVIGSIVIPFLFWALYRMMQCLETENVIRLKYYALVNMAVVAGCLCSTLATLLVCMLIGIVAIYILICYKRWKYFFLFATCMIFPVLVAGVYFLMR